MKRIGIIQSNYIPWKGYFDIINLVDEFVLYDCVQYTRRDWRNRNRIKTALGVQWLTIPVMVRGRYTQTIEETEIGSPGWADKHWKSICRAYGKSAYFSRHRDWLESLYLDCNDVMLSRVNRRFIEAMCDKLGIGTEISDSRSYDLAEGEKERLVSLCLQADADVYLSGPSAKAYLDEAAFEAAGIRVEYMDYSDYPEYRQLHGRFEHQVSIIDLIFNEGPDSPKYMKSL